MKINDFLKNTPFETCGVSVVNSNTLSIYYPGNYRKFQKGDFLAKSKDGSFFAMIRKNESFEKNGIFEISDTKKMKDYLNNKILENGREIKDDK